MTPHSAARHGERQNRILDSPHHHRTPQPAFTEQSVNPTSQQRPELPQSSIEDPFALPNPSPSVVRENLVALRAAAAAASEGLLPINRRSRRRREESSSGVNQGVFEDGIDRLRGRPSNSSGSSLPPINQYQHLPAHLQTALAQLHPQHENNAPPPLPAPVPALVPPLNSTPLPLG